MRLRNSCAMLLLVIFLSAATSAFAAYDFVKNSDFRDGLAYWQVTQGGGDSTLTAENGEVRFQGMLGSPRQSIRQALELDVSEYTVLLLKAAVRVDAASLTGTGWDGLEAPVSVFVSYTDADGTRHIQSAAGPDGRLWRGFYYADPVPPAVDTNGIKVERGVWQELELDLMQLKPRPKRIHAVGAESSGWTPRSAAIRQLSLIAPEEGQELVVNPTLAGMAAGWKPCVDFVATEYQSELVPLPQGMQLKSVLGKKRVGLMQAIEADVTAYRSLLLTAEVKVDKQHIGGTGYDGREAPLAVFVTYTDVEGITHDRLPLQAADTEKRMFWRGLYILNPQPPAGDAYGVKLDAGAWHTLRFELMELDPKPRQIHTLGVESSGRAPCDASVRLVSLKGR